MPHLQHLKSIPNIFQFSNSRLFKTDDAIATHSFMPPPEAIIQTLSQGQPHTGKHELKCLFSSAAASGNSALSEENGKPRPFTTKNLVKIDIQAAMIGNWRRGNMTNHHSVRGECTLPRASCLQATLAHTYSLYSTMVRKHTVQYHTRQTHKHSTKMCSPLNSCVTPVFFFFFFLDV